MSVGVVRWPGRWRPGVSVAAVQACVLAAFWLLSPVRSLEAVAVVTGDVTPAFPWTSSTKAYVGNTAGGTLSVDAGSQLSSGTGCLGYNAGATGVATITGAGSKLNCNALLVGKSGSGILNVATGGQINSLEDYLGFSKGASGMATISGSGSLWTNGYFGIGNLGSGSLNVTAGGHLNTSGGADVGVYSSGSGVVTVSGSGSTWSVIYNNPLAIGRMGSGTMNVVAGGQVNSTNGRLGVNVGATGVATISGAGSRWANSGALIVGTDGCGTLQVNGGGQATAGTVSVYAGSLVAVDVGNGSALSIGGGTGAINNNGKAQFTATAGAATGQYRPIAAKTFTGSGTYTAVGGTWNTTGHVFTVSPQVMAASGISTTLDVASQQRLLVSDSQGGWSVGASLLAKTGSATQVNVTATAMPYSGLGPLTMQFDPGEDLLGAWQVSLGGSGYSVGDPVYLSYPVADGASLSDLRVWHWDGTNWTAFPASDLSVSQGYANFTVTSFSGYAVSVVPEPGTLALLAAAAGLLARRRWRRCIVRGCK